MLPDGTTDGIDVAVDSVSINLAGFEIRGPIVCSGGPTVTGLAIDAGGNVCKGSLTCP